MKVAGSWKESGGRIEHGPEGWDATPGTGRAWPGPATAPSPPCPPAGPAALAVVLKSTSTACPVSITAPKSIILAHGRKAEVLTEVRALPHMPSTAEPSRRHPHSPTAPLQPWACAGDKHPPGMGTRAPQASSPLGMAQSTALSLAAGPCSALPKGSQALTLPPFAPCPPPRTRPLLQAPLLLSQGPSSPQRPCQHTARPQGLQRLSSWVQWAASGKEASGERSQEQPQVTWQGQLTAARSWQAAHSRPVKRGANIAPAAAYREKRACSD